MSDLVRNIKQLKMNSREKHNEMTENEKRARVIAQNGNEGLHYEEEFCPSHAEMQNAIEEQAAERNPTEPDHYKGRKSYDIIDVCWDYNLNFNRGNIIKYLCRAGRKDNELEDLMKAMTYLKREIDLVGNRILDELNDRGDD